MYFLTTEESTYSSNLLPISLRIFILARAKGKKNNPHEKIPRFSQLHLIPKPVRKPAIRAKTLVELMRILPPPPPPLTQGRFLSINHLLASPPALYRRYKFPTLLPPSSAIFLGNKLSYKVCPIPIFAPALTSSKQALDTFLPRGGVVGGGEGCVPPITDKFFTVAARRENPWGEARQRFLKFRPVNLCRGCRGVHGCIDRIDKGIEG